MRRTVNILLTSLIILSVYLPLSSQAQTAPVAEPTQKAGSADPKDELPLKDLRLFTLIFDHIRRSYVDPISDQQLLENAVKGMLGEMDPHSAYLDTQSFDQLQESTQGEFSGVGIHMGSEGGYIKIISPIDGTPAEKAGLKAGDIIIKIDQESIQGLSVNETATKIRGPIGSSIVFTITRKDLDEPLDISVIRDTIRSVSVRHKLIEKTIGYIRIAQFQANTGNDFIKAVKKLRADQPLLSGFIIDLRNNPGGILQASVQVVDSLINDGLVVYTQGRLDSSNVNYTATEGDDANGLPIIVLVNGGSASAAEIVAGALQDHNRAVVMGTRTFGKGSVQTILPVGKDKGIKLTTARYFTPNGRSIQAQGIEPDIIVKPATITAIDVGERISEATLGGHLKNTSDTSEREEKKANTSEKKDKKNYNTKDNQLFEALNLLKGLAIFTKNNSRQK
ncbi:MAG: carboxyl-terminal processing protease [Kiritimatiellia bacterium]|jgi:carboxyl-terminal processing protease